MTNLKSNFKLNLYFSSYTQRDRLNYRIKKLNMI
jgi:hypothetical protein